MKLFDGYEAVRFPEENLILITHESYLYYIYSPENGSWKKHKNAGYDRLTVSNYQEISKEELTEAMHGIYPQKKTDFLRLCHPSYLDIGDMIDLLEVDYSAFMGESKTHSTVRDLLLEAENCNKVYLLIKKLFDEAIALHQDNSQVYFQIRELCFTVLGRDIHKHEIPLADDRSMLFSIMPVRVIDDSDTNDFDNVSEMSGIAVSLDDTDAYIYLSPFLDKYFDADLEANKKRLDYYSEDDDGNETPVYLQNFEWYLTHNFFTFDSVLAIIKDIRKTIDSLSSGKENEFTAKIREKRGFEIWDRLEEEINPTELIIDFYRRLIYRLEYMLTVGKENGFNLISFMGP